MMPPGPPIAAVRTARPSRRALLGAGAGLALATLSGCTTGTALGPEWIRSRLGAVTLPVPRSWTHSAPARSDGLWEDLWAEPGGGLRLIAGRPTMSQDPSRMLDEARSSLARASTGLVARAVEASGADSDGGVRLVEDLTTTTPGAEHGRLWLLSNGEEGIAVALLGEELDAEVLGAISDGLAIDAASGAPALAEGWRRAGVGALSLAVPVDWSATGALVGSTRWRAGWADTDDDGTARARVLLAPSMEQTSALDALARIESDSVAGALPGFERLSDVEAVPRDGLEILRLRFGADGQQEGALWALASEGRVVAVQLVIADAALAGVAEVVEESLWMS